jgi:hypothetical protein
MWLAIDLKGALDYIQLPKLIRNDTIVPEDFPECTDSPYRSGYDWLYRYERSIAGYLEPWLQPYRYELIGEKGILCEALANAFSHGHCKNPKKAISLRVYLGVRGLVVRVSDSGKGFDVNSVIQGYLKKKVYYHTAGNGVRRMATSKQFGIFYDRSGSAFHMLYDFEQRFAGLTVLDRSTEYLYRQQGSKAQREGHRTLFVCSETLRRAVGADRPE